MEERTLNLRFNVTLMTDIQVGCRTVSRGVEREKVENQEVVVLTVMCNRAI